MLHVCLSRDSNSGAPGRVEIPTDSLVVTPTQFGADDARGGTLRRYAQMVLAVTYIDPNVAPPRLLASSTLPLLDSIEVSVTEGSVTVSAHAIGDSAAGALTVTAWLVAGGQTAALITLTSDGQGGYSATVARPPGLAGEIAVIVQVADQAGNITAETLSASLGGFLQRIYLPAVAR